MAERELFGTGKTAAELAEGIRTGAIPSITTELTEDELWGIAAGCPPAQRDFLTRRLGPPIHSVFGGITEPWRIEQRRAKLAEYLARLSHAILPSGAEIEHINPLIFDMLVEDDGECHVCGVELPRGSIVWQKPAGPWWPAGRSGAWYWRPAPGIHVEVCQACAAAELLPQWDKQERQRIIAAARGRLAENTRTARAVVDGITWTVTVRLEEAEWLMSSVRQTEVLPGCHLWGLARWTGDDVVELRFEGLPSRVRRELERELWLELKWGGEEMRR